MNYCSSLELNILNNDDVPNIVRIYCSLSVVQEHFLNILEIFLDDITKTNSCVFCDDINIDLNQVNINTFRYQNILSFYGLKSCINKATRVNFMNGLSTCIGHIVFLNIKVFDNVIEFLCKNNLIHH